MTILVVTFTPKPNKFQEFEKVFASVIPRVHDEPGCELYALSRSGERLVLIEKWTDDAALEAHRNAAAIGDLRRRTADLADAPTVILTLEPLPAGDTAKGAL